MRKLFIALALGLCPSSVLAGPAEWRVPPGATSEPSMTQCRTYSHSRSSPKRSRHARTAFKHAHPCPATGKGYGPCPGYVIDHVKPLKRGGADAPRNMQWQTTQGSKAKDKWE